MTSTVAEMKRVSIAALWQASPPHDWPFNPELLTTVPAVVRHYNRSARTHSDHYCGKVAVSGCVGYRHRITDATCRN